MFPSTKNKLLIKIIFIHDNHLILIKNKRINFNINFLSDPHRKNYFINFK